MAQLTLLFIPCLLKEGLFNWKMCGVVLRSKWTTTNYNLVELMCSPVRSKCLFEFLFGLTNRYAVHYCADPSRHSSSDKSNPMFAVIFVYFSKTTHVNSTQAWESTCSETVLLGTCSGV